MDTASLTLDQRARGGADEPAVARRRSGSRWHRLGGLFESLAVLYLRAYADATEAAVYHYRDSDGLEVDAIVEARDGTWGGFEIKLGTG